MRRRPITSAVLGTSLAVLLATGLGLVGLGADLGRAGTSPQAAVTISAASAARTSGAALAAYPTQVRAGALVSLRGTVRSGPRPAQLQRRVGTSWQGIVWVTTTRAGAFRFDRRFKPARTTTYVLRVVAPVRRVNGHRLARVVTPQVAVRVTVPVPATSAPPTTTPSAAPTATPTGSATASASATTSATATTSAATATGTPAPDSDAAWEDRVLQLVNQERATAGCASVASEPHLKTAAIAHSTDMATNAYFSHTSQDGRTMVNRVEAAGYTDWSRLGENIAAGQRSPEAVMDAWMHSDGHRANILNCAFTELGVGLAWSSSGTPYWTQDFGTR
jgi:uncharacterized protein YkwD